jgi:methyl-accepting chemotaxis protein
MKNLKISVKLMVSFMIVVVLMFFIGAAGILGMSQMNARSNSLYETQTTAIPYLAKTSETIQRIRVSVRDMVFGAMAGDMQKIEDSYATITRYMPVMTENLDAYRAKIAGADPEIIKLFDDSRALYENDLVQTVVSIYEASKIGDMDSINNLLMVCREISDVVINNFDELMEVKISEADNAVKGINNISNIFLIVIIFIMILAVAAAIILALYLSGIIAKPLLTATASLNEVEKSIEASVHQFTDSATSLAESSNEQAASIQETSATMNETSAMIAQNAENTRQAAQLATQSKKSADIGSDKMREMVNSMNKLKESSGTISRIVRTINEIAFQTNLLAINATIEAARAGGEAGRSFAVVANEVRNLAQKSADSAAETTEIIEQNIILTNASSKISVDVAGSLEEITNQFDNLNQIITEISAASEEQASGVNQINIALTHMEETTQSNAAVSEQSAASAKMLEDLIAELAKVYLDIDFVVEGKKAE